MLLPTCKHVQQLFASRSVKQTFMQALEDQLRALHDSAAAVAARRERVAAQLEAGVPEPVEALAHAQAALAAAHQLQVLLTIALILLLLGGAASRTGRCKGCTNPVASRLPLPPLHASMVCPPFGRGHHVT